MPSIPEIISLTRSPGIESRACRCPRLGGLIEAVDLPLSGRSVPQAAPPRAVVEPQLALRLLTRWRAHRRPIRKVAIARNGRFCCRSDLECLQRRPYPGQRDDDEKAEAGAAHGNERARRWGKQHRRRHRGLSLRSPVGRSSVIRWFVSVSGG